MSPKSSHPEKPEISTIGSLPRLKLGFRRVMTYYNEDHEHLQIVTIPEDAPDPDFAHVKDGIVRVTRSHFEKQSDGSLRFISELVSESPA